MTLRKPAELAAGALRESFLRWQCRVRQLAMREGSGRPDDSISPLVTLQGDTAPVARIITVLSKVGSHSKLPELQHMVKRTHDPAQRREKAIEFFSEYYYQHPIEFSDTLTATFQPHSSTVEVLLNHSRVILFFEAYNQRYELHCSAKLLKNDDELYQATWWHNSLFNPSLHPHTRVLAFVPDWSSCSAHPTVGQFYKSG